MILFIKNIVAEKGAVTLKLIQKKIEKKNKILKLNYKKLPLKNLHLTYSEISFLKIYVTMNTTIMYCLIRRRRRHFACFINTGHHCFYVFLPHIFKKPNIENLNRRKP